MTAPHWSPVDSDTDDLLSLVADEGHPSADHEWATYLAAVRRVAGFDGLVTPNALRALVRGTVAPRRVGAFANRALAAGILRPTGEWEVSTDTEGRNGGKPCRVYRVDWERLAAAETTRPQAVRKHVMDTVAERLPG